MSLFARARADQARTYVANDAARYAQIQAEKRKKLTVNSGTPIKTNNTKIVFQPDGSVYSTAPETPVVDFSIKFGGGVQGKFKVMGVGVEVGGAIYYDLTDVASSNPTQTMEFSVLAQATDKVQIGGSFQGVINPETKEHLQNKGFVGVKIGKTVFGFDNFPYSSDITLDFEAGGFVGVGGEISLSINVSEIWRRICKLF